ncbi:UNVERIFIED_CONTAM: hypothetical protein Sradi_2442800 [Sesamum radiatum]|uniref:Uncharacterized protein n=1 Tax=Sesamum radiatum TaxID=300843 RepID=A0AAW2SI91_SESRA
MGFVAGTWGGNGFPKWMPPMFGGGGPAVVPHHRGVPPENVPTPAPAPAPARTSAPAPTATAPRPALQRKGRGAGLERIFRLVGDESWTD